MRGALLLLVILCAASVQAAPPADPAPSVRQQCFDRIEKIFRRDHLDLTQIDRAAVCREVVAHVEGGLPQPYIDDWLYKQINNVRFAFARSGAHHQGRARYRYPFQAWMPRMLSQAYGGRTHSTPDQYHSFDFLMPTGTRILAARAGRVVSVHDGTAEGVHWDEDSGNIVRILHKDGTWAIYAHLQAGIPVEVGQQVQRGEFIAHSGNTGYSDTPHLHLTVQRMDRLGEIKSLPILWGQPGSKGFSLREGHHWGGQPKSRRKLRVLLNEREGTKEAPIPMRYGSRARLRVEQVAKNGSVTDVTLDARTRYETMTVWNLYSPERGRIRVEPVPEIDRDHLKKALPLLSESEALMFVYHGEPKDADFGSAAIHIQVEPEGNAP